MHACIMTYLHALSIHESVTESMMEKLCYAPFGIKDLTLTSDGGTFSLGSSDASLKVPPGAVKKKSTIRYAILLHGPFGLPPGYRAVSVVVYLNLSKTTLLQPIFLLLSDWCEKRYSTEQYELRFFSAPHELKGEKMLYQFNPLRNADHQNENELRITESKTLYTKVLKEGHGVHDLYCMMPIQKLDAAESCLRMRILFTWSSDSWREVSCSRIETIIYSQRGMCSFFMYKLYILEMMVRALIWQFGYNHESIRSLNFCQYVCTYVQCTVVCANIQCCLGGIRVEVCAKSTWHVMVLLKYRAKVTHMHSIKNLAQKLFFFVGRPIHEIMLLNLVLYGFSYLESAKLLN